MSRSLHDYDKPSTGDEKRNNVKVYMERTKGRRMEGQHDDELHYEKRKKGITKQ